MLIISFRLYTPRKWVMHTSCISLLLSLLLALTPLPRPFNENCPERSSLCWVRNSLSLYIFARDSAGPKKLYFALVSLTEFTEEITNCRILFLKLIGYSTFWRSSVFRQKQVSENQTRRRAVFKRNSRTQRKNIWSF